MSVEEYLVGAWRDILLKVSSSPSIYLNNFLLGNLTTFPKMPFAIPSLRSITKVALSSAHLALFSSYNGVLGGAPESCPNPQLSCHNTTAVANTCCFNAPGGQLLQTQFWDTSPSTGPSNHWTVHGLWYDGS